jgi:tRNA(Ile)-lysidine synthase
VIFVFLLFLETAFMVLSLEMALQDFWQNTAPVQPALVAVSGGADSLALLHALLRIRPDYPALRLAVAHFNHHIRAEAASEDALFVEAFCEKHSLPFHLGELDVPALAARRKLSLEDAARQARYAFLADLAAQLGFSLVLTGHHADDQAETVLLRLLRGTGPQGLAGMARLGPLPPSSPALKILFPLAGTTPVMLGRPFLPVWRHDIEAYAGEHRLNPRLDETNLASEYARNRVRRQLLPLLEGEYQPNIKQNLIRLADLTRTDQEWLDQLVEAEFQANAKYEFGCKFSFSKEYFVGKPASLQKRLIRRTALALGGLENLDAAHIEAALDLFKSPAVRRVDLPGTLVAFTAKTEVGLLAVPEAGPWPSAGLELAIPGRVSGPAGGWQLTATLVDTDTPEGRWTRLKLGGPYHVFLDYAKIKTSLLLRPRRAGESYRPLGGPGQRKVQDIMLDAGIPRELRQDWPLVVCPAQADRPEAICWIPGAPLAHDFRVTPGTGPLVELRFEFLRLT